jgi:ABC-type multidrug transport system fused ATPase/permease subunit
MISTSRYGGKLLHDQKLSVGVLTSFFAYMIQVAVAFAFVASLYGGKYLNSIGKIPINSRYQLLDFRQAVGASERLFSLLDRRPTIPATSNDSCLIHPIDFDGSIRFDHVSFTYPTRPEQRVLTNISFTIKHRQKVALVGPSGGGKSTIASLIERFYDPDSGTIYFDSQPLTSIDPQWLRQNVSFVNQEPSLFACSIRDNITFGVNQATISLDEIIQVAKLANAHEFIEQFEDKYDTLVGERGVRLSGGQRQRLASEYEIDNEPIRDYRCVSVARALLMNPKLLLLDEATSALDAENEYLIEEAIDRAIINRTVLVIAHRLSTVRNADLVLVIDQGQIVEQVNHLFKKHFFFILFSFKGYT